MAEKQTKRSSQLKYWFLWQVAVPLGVLALFWPVHKFVLEDKFSFQSAFGPGDLLLFSALLLMGVAVQAKTYEIDSGSRDDSLSFERELARAIAFFSVFIYGGIRYHFVLMSGDVSMNLRTGYACLSCSSVILAVGLGMYSLAKAEKMVLTQREERNL